MDALIVQAGLAGPLLFALVVQTGAMRREGLLQGTLFCLLTLILAWMIGIVMEASEVPAVRAASVWLLLPSSCLMSPLFCLAMLVYARIEPFEESRAARWALFAPFWLFLLGFVTNDWHGLMADGTATVRQMADFRAGPLFWTFQIWSNGAAFVGLVICLRILWSSPSPAERARAARLVIAAFIPLVTHITYVYRLLPLDFSLTPTSLGVTAILLVTTIRRYRLLEVPHAARRDVIEAARDAIVIANLEEIVVDVNPAALRIFRAPIHELQGRSLRELWERLGVRDREFDLEGTLSALRRDVPVADREFETSDAQVLELSVGRLRGTSGESVGYYAVLRDRTRERRSERMLHQSQKLESVGILAAGVAHEVNNPLAYVRANLVQIRQLAGLLDETRDRLPKEVDDASEEMSEMVEESLNGLDRMREVVQSLLHFSRKPTERVDPCDVNPIVEESARFASFDRQSGVALELQLTRPLPQVAASPDRLAQVFLNLFLNAMHALAGRDDARVVASTSAREGFVEIRIADNGPGVPEAIRAHIFDPFFTTRDPNEGTGLGLAIAFDIVNDFAGVLELEQGPDGGACFVVRLPAATRPA